MSSENTGNAVDASLDPEDNTGSITSQEFVENWLAKNGVSLELRIASLFRKHLPSSISSAVDHGRIYIDQEAGQTLRESDVVVNFTNTFGRDTALTIWIVIECKSSMKSPWVFYRGDKATNLFGRYDQMFNSGNSNGFRFQSVAGLSSIQLFDVTHKYFSYSVNTATNESENKDRRNLARESVLQVLSATKGIMQDSILPEDRPAGVIFIPIVVTKADMFKVVLLEDGSLQVTPTDSELLINRFISVNGDVDAAWVIHETQVENRIIDFCQGLSNLFYG